MASLSQLQLVVSIEGKKESALARQYQQAKDHLFNNQQKLSVDDFILVQRDRLTVSVFNNNSPTV